MDLKLETSNVSRAVVSTIDDDVLLDNEVGVPTPAEARHIKLARCGTFVNLESNVSVSLLVNILPCPKIDFDQVNCAGAVLADLHRRRSIGLLPDGQSAEFVFHVRDLRSFSLSNTMLVNSEALQCLQIVRSELHPNNHVWGAEPSSNGIKESLSVYGLFHFLARTPQGRVELRKMFLRPTLDLAIISERHRSVSLFIRPDNVEHVKQVGAALRKVQNAKASIIQLRRGVDSPSSGKSFDKGAWAVLRNFAAQALKLREALGAMSNSDTAAIVGEVRPLRCSTTGCGS